MRLLINYFRTCLCKHDFEKEEIYCEAEESWGGSRKGYRVFLYCPKCGYHKSFWKY